MLGDSGLLTCRTVPPGGSYFDEKKQRIVHVPKTHHAITCQAKNCEYSLHFPNHLVAELEQRRQRHLKDLHYNEILLGTMTIHLEYAWEDFELAVKKITNFPL